MRSTFEAYVSEVHDPLGVILTVAYRSRIPARPDDPSDPGPIGMESPSTSRSVGRLGTARGQRRYERVKARLQRRADRYNREGIR